MRLKILLKRKNHAFVLVVLRETKGREIGQPIDMVAISLQIPLHFQSAAPTLEGEHRLPIEPEVAAPEMIIEEIADLLAFQFFIAR